MPAAGVSSSAARALGSRLGDAKVQSPLLRWLEWVVGPGAAVALATFGFKIGMGVSGVNDTLNLPPGRLGRLLKKLKPSRPNNGEGRAMTVATYRVNVTAQAHAALRGSLRLGTPVDRAAPA